MVSRIATAFQNQTSLRNLQKSSDGIALSIYQATTGNKARNLSEIPQEANRILSLRELQTRNTTYVTGMTSANNQLKAMESALQSMSDLLQDAAQTATLGRNENSATTRATLAPKAQSLVNTFYNLFNTQFEGQYLFSGQNGLNSPVSDAPAARAYPGDPLPTTWYEGDNSLPAVVTGPGTTLQYGVLGNDPAFTKIKAGLEALWNGLQTNNLSDLDSAITALNSARTDLSGSLGQVGGQMNTITQISEKTTTQNEFLKEQSDGLEKMDLSTALTTLSQQQATMDASMAAIMQLNQLSLLNYLR